MKKAYVSLFKYTDVCSPMVQTFECTPGKEKRQYLSVITFYVKDNTKINKK